MNLGGRDIEDDLAQALRMPFGVARNAAIEKVVAVAESQDTPAFVNHVLTELTASYLYSTETPKLLVPLAKLIRNWDTAPQHFDQRVAYSMFWSFKWATWEMIRHVDAPLSGIEAWLTDMARRYREQGYSLQSVHKSEHLLADHLGDSERAQRAFDAWMSAPRDTMSDCLACDTANFGEWFAGRDDATSIETWQPLLVGDQRCQEEPKCTLANSLLPLVRLGLASQARDNHLRGYRMVRDDDVLPSGLAQHIEFCALTGNEAKALHILTEKGHYLDAEIDSAYQLELCETTLLLMQRLIELNRGNDPVSGPRGRQWTVTELAAWIQPRLSDLVRRFDARNGTSAVSERSTKRLAQRPFETIPLGLAIISPLAPPVTDDLDKLIAHAETFDQRRAHPDAITAWHAVAEEATRQGVELSLRHQADVMDARAHEIAQRDATEAADLWTKAAELHQRSGDEASAAWCRSEAGRVMGPAGTELAMTALAELERLHADGLASDRQLLRARLVEIWVAMWQQDADSSELVERLNEHARQIGVLPDGADKSTLQANRLLMSGIISERDGDIDSAQQRLAEAIELWVDADAGWRTAATATKRVELLHRLGRAEEAGVFASQMIAVDGIGSDPAEFGRLNLALAQNRMALGRFGGAVDVSLRAATLLDQAGLDRSAAYARYLTGMAFHHTGRFAEAADMLSNALPNMTDVEPASVRRAQWALAESFTQLEEHRRAAETYLLAAGEAEAGGESTQQAALAAAAGESLQRLGEDHQAAKAYERAVALHRGEGDLLSAALPARRLIWLEASADELDLVTLERLVGAARDLAEELQAAAGAGETEAQYRLEAALCRLDAGRLVVRFHGRVDDIGDEADRLMHAALTDLRASRDVFADQRFIGALKTADYQTALLLVLSDRPDDAAAGLEAALTTDYPGDDESAAAAREDLAEVLNNLRSRP